MVECIRSPDVCHRQRCRQFLFATSTKCLPRGMPLLYGCALHDYPVPLLSRVTTAVCGWRSNSLRPAFVLRIAAGQGLNR